MFKFQIPYLMSKAKIETLLAITISFQANTLTFDSQNACFNATMFW